MKRPVRTVASRLHVCQRWAWVSLVPLLAGACKPHDVLCETGAIFQALNPEQGAGAAPFSIERLGPEVDRGVLGRLPWGLTLKSDNRVEASWLMLSHMTGYSDLIFSPAEGLARNVDGDPKDVYPMRRFVDGKSERVQFGFRSSACRDPGKFSSLCVLGENRLFLVADMTCREQ